MKNSFYVFICILVLLSFGRGGLAQDLKNGQVSVRFKTGLTVIFSTETDPPGFASELKGSVRVRDDGIIHRAFIDPKRGVYLGYDLVVEPSGDSSKVKLTIGPLSVPPVRVPEPPYPAKAGTPATGSMAQWNDTPQTEKLRELKLPMYPEPQFVQQGDTLAVELMTNVKTGVRVMDLMQVTTTADKPAADSVDNPSIATSSTVEFSNRQPASNGENSIAADFSIDAVQLNVTGCKLLVNGQKEFGGEANSTLGVKGALIWFYLENRGRFILSLVPRPGYDFQKIGMIENNRAVFSIDGNTYEWISSAPIVGGAGGRWNLWVLHEPNFRPGIIFGHSDPWQIGAFDATSLAGRKE